MYTVHCYVRQSDKIKFYKSLKKDTSVSIILKYYVKCDYFFFFFYNDIWCYKRTIQLGVIDNQH